MKKFNIAVVTACLSCMLAFFIAHLVKAAITPSRPSLSDTRQVKEIEGYRSWTKVNSVPQLMPARVATACADILSARNMMLDGSDNPHRDKFFTVYVNSIGRKAMLNQEHPKFPDGSIIVKEKLSARDSQKPELLTVMIKQREGFNPASGDWEYMLIDGAGTKIEGRRKLQHCQDCHTANAKTDYIFRTYLPVEVETKLK